jgi:hypothetical protein
MESTEISRRAFMTLDAPESSERGAAVKIRDDNHRGKLNG